jgi:transposase
MAPQYVKPYVKTNKNDKRDAEAICEAVSRPTMRFVPIKTAAQQAILCLHRGRAGFVKSRTAQSNQMRGLLSEFGIVFPKGVKNLINGLPAVLEEKIDDLPGTFLRLMNRLLDHLKELDRHVNELGLDIEAYHRENEACKRIGKLEGIGPITATALIATIGNGREFNNGREVSAWLGLVPRQHSTGGKNSLGGISKRGDTYLRTLLIHGARSALRLAGKEGSDTWKDRLVRRRNKNVAAVALANKNVRIIWAMLFHDREYNPDFEETRIMAEAS